MTINWRKWRKLWAALPESGWPVSAAIIFLKSPPRWFFACSIAFGLVVVGRAFYLIGFGSADEVNKFIVGVAAFAGAPFLIWRTWIADRQRHLAQEELYTSLLTRAVEQLGATREEKTEDGQVKIVPNTEVRLGGIYALEKLARDYLPLYTQIIEIICAYVRRNAQPSKSASDEIKKILEKDRLKRSSEEAEILKRYESTLLPHIDVQAALTVIGRRTESQRKLEEEQAEEVSIGRYNKLDLRKACLRSAELYKLYLDHVNFSEACLDHADLTMAHLKQANFFAASLAHATFDNANLEGADLNYASLRQAFLRSARLENAELNSANLDGANLRDASLDGASLIGASLGGAGLEDTTLRGAHLEGASFGKYWNFGVRPARMSGACLEGAHIEGADLSQVSGLTQEQINAAIGDNQTLLPDHLSRPAHWGPDEPTQS